MYPQLVFGWTGRRLDHLPFLLLHRRYEGDTTARRMTIFIWIYIYIYIRILGRWENSAWLQKFYIYISIYIKTVGLHQKQTLAQPNRRPLPVELCWRSRRDEGAAGSEQPLSTSLSPHRLQAQVLPLLKVALPTERQQHNCQTRFLNQTG